MKKKMIFLITILAIILGVKKVYAEEYRFYEAEYIYNIYMNKYQYSNNTIYYQTARKFRNSYTGEVVYCIEPLTFFNENSTYTITSTPRNLSNAQLDRIKKIIYFGYNYKHHTDDSWYAVTQMMIWRESNPYEGDYYFTETLNGQRTNKFDDMITEINQLINEYDKGLSLENKTYTIVEGETKELVKDSNLNNYKTNNIEISLENGVIKTNELTEGEYSINLTKQNERKVGNPFIIYDSPNSQTLMLAGDLDNKVINFKIKVVNTSIKIIKTDQDTEDIIPQGEAKLDGSIFQLYNKNKEPIQELEIINGEVEIKDIPFGTYYLKEIKTGEGYTLNDTEYEITLSEDNCHEELIIPNKVIEKEITIKKLFGDESNLHPEGNISFEVINQNQEVVETITTNDNGITTFKIPYGTYTIKQINTTEGYELVTPFLLIIDNDKNEIIELKDFKIPVPNTSTKEQNTLLKIIIYFILMLC